MGFDLEPVTLEGEYVRLVPYESSHVAPLWLASQAGDVWRWMPFSVRSQEELARFVEAAITLAGRREGLGFTIFDRRTSDVIGATGFWNPCPEHRRIEIGATWITRRFQRTAVNTEAKLLLLLHAFETLGCIRVEFKADARNTRSRAALRRIGATEEGTLRNHMVLPDGHLRDSVYFSVLASEWPHVERLLHRLLDRPS